MFFQYHPQCLQIKLKLWLRLSVLVVWHQLQHHTQIRSHIDFHQSVVFVLYQNKRTQNEILLASVLDKLTVACHFIQLLNVMGDLPWWEIMTQLELLCLVTFYSLCSFVLLHVPHISFLIWCEFQYSRRQYTTCFESLRLESVRPSHHCHWITFDTRNHNNRKCALVAGWYYFRSFFRTAIN